MSDGNFKVRCLKDGGYDRLYTVGKIYEVINGVFTFNDFETMNEIESVEDLSANTSAIWELVEDKSSDLRELIKPCYVVIRRDGSVCGIFEIKEGLKLQKKLDMGNCDLDDYKNNLTKYNYPDSTDIVEIYGLSENGCFDISIKDRPIIWKREEAPVKSPQQLEIESIEEEQRRLADRLSKLKESIL